MTLQQAAEALQQGRSVTLRPRGHSMTGVINDGEEVTVIPPTSELAVGDAVLCRVQGRYYLHLIKAINGKRYLIGNNRGGINGWTTQVFGVVSAPAAGANERSE